MIEDLPPDLVELIGQPCFPQLSDGVVEAGAIRLFASAVQDGTAAYWRSDGTAVSPPALLSAWNRPLKWQPQAADAAPGLALHFLIKSRLDLPRAVVTESETEMVRAMAEGARVQSRQILVEIGAPVTNRLGRGRYWTIRLEYLCAETGALFGAEVLRFFGYGAESQA